MTLAMIVFGQIGMVMNCRTEKQSLFKIGLFTNQKVLIGIVFEVALIAFMMYVPFMHNLFNTAPLGLSEWIILLCVPFPALLLDEARKCYIRNNLY